MKGFSFDIKNNLLEKKHLKNMGIAVWLFMWLDDKITRVDEDGTGWVLGGKPVLYTDVKKDFGISASTYTRWVDMLEKYPYIKAIRTPTGISYRIYKAHKNFGDRKKVKKGFHTSDEGYVTSDESDTAHVTNPNKTITVDNYSDIPAASAGEDKFTPLGADLLKAFESINPACKKYYNRPPQRQACEDLIAEYGFERVKAIVEKTLPHTNKIPWIPTITTPVQLFEKWSALEAGVNKLKNKSASKGRGVEL